MASTENKIQKQNVEKQMFVTEKRQAEEELAQVKSQQT